MKKSILAAIIFCIAIASCLAVGKLTAWAIGGLPASLYGMLFFCAALQLNWLSADSAAVLAERSISWMPVVFLPICVGVIEYKEILKNSGLLILVVGLVTTLLTISTVGYCAQIYVKRVKR